MKSEQKDSYNVWVEPWIPVRQLKGAITRMSMRDVLLNAHELVEITDISPLVEYGLYRLVITLLTDALRPEIPVDLVYMRERGSFDIDALDNYVTQCESSGFSFDLFDPSHPFLQTRYNSEWDKVLKPASALDYTLPHGNNHVHFKHSSSEVESYTYDEAARMLPAVQLFCTAGTQGPSGVNASPPYFTIVRGETLFETLVRSMIPTSSIGDLDSEGPWWRNDREVIPKSEVLQTSWLMGMIFPARRILLKPDNGRISKVYLGAGLNFSLKETWQDPHVAYIQRKDAKGNVIPDRAPWRPRLDVPIWLNIEQLISRDQQAEIVKIANHDDDVDMVDLQMYGVQTNQAKYVDCARFELTLPNRLMDNDIGREKARRCVEDAKEVAFGLRKSLPVGGTQKRSRGTHFSSATVDSAVWEYYGRCESALWGMLEQLSKVSCIEEADAVHIDWMQHCKKSAIDVYNETLNASNLDAHDLMSLYEPRRWLYGAIGKCMPKLQTEGDDGKEELST